MKNEERVKNEERIEREDDSLATKRKSKKCTMTEAKVWSGVDEIDREEEVETQ